MKARAPSSASAVWLNRSRPAKERLDRPAMESLSALNECLRNRSAVGEYEPMRRPHSSAVGSS